ncbi:MAG: hypothetical protein JWQ54_2551 [Mucilaginibacter sp.]|nr:hypothetical protein [Mucilaginibacter sp.]
MLVSVTFAPPSRTLWFIFNHGTLKESTEKHGVPLFNIKFRLAVIILLFILMMRIA